MRDRSWTWFGLAWVTALVACGWWAYRAFADVALYHEGSNSPLYGGVFLGAQAIQLAAIPLLAYAIAFRETLAFAAAKVLAGVLTACGVLVYLHDNTILSLMFGTWACIGAVIYGVGFAWSAWRIPGRSRKPVYLATVAALLGGFYLGTQAWSETVPEAIAEAAGRQAAGAPYCVSPGERRESLLGRRFLSIGFVDFPDWHAVLVVDADGGRTAFNWSFRSGRFLPISGKRFTFDPTISCTPVIEGNLPWARHG